MKRLVVFSLVAATLCACGGKKTQTVEETPKVLTKTTIAQAGKVALTEVFTSEIEPYKENSIMPAATGVHIDKIMVDVGSRVSKGELIVTLDPTQYNQQKVNLKTVEDNYARMLPVYEAGGISKQEIDNMKAQLDVQREVVENLYKNIEVRSPLTGVVTARNAEPGDLFANQPILHIMQINPLKIMANVSEQFYPYVKNGMKVKIIADVFPDREFEGVVSLVYPALDSATRTFTVEVTVPNKSETLRPGMFARTIFNMGEKDGVLVPDVAVQKQMGSAERYVYVIKDGAAERRSVKVGRQIGDKVDILSGVAAGEEVAVTALSRLGDGVQVEVRN